MLSMTGYGRAFVEIEGRQMTVEVKSVNHRFWTCPSGCRVT